MQKTKSGFTIVELLIVIVVIAILAAISIIAYNGIQQRANNTSIIGAVTQTIKAVQLYYVQEGSYPSTSGYACVTTSSGCVEANGTTRTANATFDNNVAKIGSISRSIPNSGTVGNGIIYSHDVNRQYNNQARPALLMYFLNGQSQDCGVSDVMTAWGTPGQEAVSSSTGYTANHTTSNKTVCFVSLQ